VYKNGENEFVIELEIQDWQFVMVLIFSMFSSRRIAAQQAVIGGRGLGS